MSISIWRVVLPTTSAATCLLATAAFAHPGHGLIDFGGGITHPLSGIDHLAAMVAVGLWAAQLGKRATWLVPTAFVCMMIAGASLAAAGASLPFAEQAIAASVLVLGLLITFALRLSMLTGIAIVGLFALFHGWAHGHEFHATGSLLQFTAGFILATLFLHGVGILLGRTLNVLRHNTWTRLAGLSLVGCGALLLLGIA
jgi:urease accessory protein